MLHHLSPLSISQIMKRILFPLALLFVLCEANATSRILKDLPYAERDSGFLKMDLYLPAEAAADRPCIIFVFGGGFLAGDKSKEVNTKFCRELSERGFVTAAINYRLGLKGVKGVGPLNVKPLQEAIRMAVEDLYDATAFLCKNSKSYGIDSEKIIICGSSAGAVTVLQADYERSRGTALSARLPENFRYAGVVSLAGAILSFEGKPDYLQRPAPTYFFHGTDDKVVVYNKMQVFNMGFFGSHALIKRFEKFGYPYAAYRYRDMGHEIAELPMQRNVDDIIAFIRLYALEKRPLRSDFSLKDETLKPYLKLKSHKDLY